MLAVFQMASCLVGTIVNFSTGFHFLLAILPELSPVELYVIHYMHLADVFSIRQTVWLSKSPLLCNLYTK
jgi:hypothetical protein